MEHFQMTNTIHKTANVALGKAQNEKRKECWRHNAEFFIENKMKTCSRYLITKNAENIENDIKEPIE